MPTAEYFLNTSLTKTRSNTVKAFVESSKAKQLVVDDTDSDDEDEVSDSDDGDGGNDDPAVGFEYVMTDGVTSYKAETDAVILEDHLRCCSHTLNLIARTDAESALQSASYKKLYR